MGIKKLSKQKEKKFDTILANGIKTADWTKKQEFIELKAHAIKKAVKINHRYVRN